MISIFFKSRTVEQLLLSHSSFLKTIYLIILPLLFTPLNTSVQSQYDVSYFNLTSDFTLLLRFVNEWLLVSYRTGGLTVL